MWGDLPPGLVDLDSDDSWWAQYLGPTSGRDPWAEKAAEDMREHISARHRRRPVPPNPKTNPRTRTWQRASARKLEVRTSFQRLQRGDRASVVRRQRAHGCRRRARQARPQAGVAEDAEFRRCARHQLGRGANAQLAIIRRRIDLSPIRGRPRVDPGSIRGRVKIDLGSLRDSSGIHPRSIRAQARIH